MAELDIVIVRTQDEMAEALAVRRAVFIDEQHVPLELEVDEHDGDPATVSTALHVLARLDGLAVATGRLLFDTHAAENPHIGRVAVLRESRGSGYGTVVMQALHEQARQRGFAGITLAAQLHAIGFYERLGYAARGDVFLDAGIQHRWMDLKF